MKHQWHLVIPKDADAEEMAPLLLRRIAGAMSAGIAEEGGVHPGTQALRTRFVGQGVAVLHTLVDQQLMQVFVGYDEDAGMLGVRIVPSSHDVMRLSLAALPVGMLTTLVGMWRMPMALPLVIALATAVGVVLGLAASALVYALVLRMGWLPARLLARRERLVARMQRALAQSTDDLDTRWQPGIVRFVAFDHRGPKRVEPWDGLFRPVLEEIP
jgi:hypothetical protein